MSVCKQCGLPVHWFKDAKGVWKCHDEGTTTDHWDLCRETANKGRIFDDAAKSKPVMIRGANFDPDAICDCKFDVPPWLECENCPKNAMPDDPLTAEYRARMQE